MAQTTTVQGRFQVPTPDQNYDTVIDGGNALFAAINAAFTKISDNMIGRWSNDIVLASGGTTTYTHNFGQALTQLKVLIFVSNALLPKATQDAQFTISQSSTNVISIANISGVDKTFQIYVLAFPLSVRTADIDESIDAVVTRLEFTGGILFDEISTPATPSSGKVALYAKNDKKLYTVNSLGTEVQVGAGAGGSGKNYLSTYADFSLDPSTGMVNNLTATGNRGSNTTVWGANTTSLLSQTSTALRDTTSAQLVNGSSTSNFIESPLFTLESIDVNTNQLFISFDMNSVGTSVATNDWLLQVIRYNSSGVFQENITPSITSVPSGYYQFKCAFNHSATATDQYAIRFRSNTATARTLTIDTLVVGPQAAISSAAIGAWLAFTPTFSAGFGTVTNAAGYYRRVGDSMEVVCSGTAGTTAASLATMTVPNSLNINSALLPISNSTSNDGPIVGNGHDANASASRRFTILTATVTSTSLVYFGVVDATGSDHLVPANGSSIVGNSTNFGFRFTVPISQWTANVTLSGNPNIEYASNSSATDAADTTSFVNGATGSVGVLGTTSLTAIRKKRVRFQTAIQPTDRLVLEIMGDTTSNRWLPIIGMDFTTGLGSFQYQNTVGYGMSLLDTTINSTDIDVVFGQYCYPSGATYGAAGTSWTTAAYKWRVAKYSAVGLAEIAPATATTPGTVTRENVWTAYTPAITGLGTITNLSAFYKVMGDSLFIRVRATTGTPSAALVTCPIPSGFTISNTKIPTNATGASGPVIGSHAIQASTDTSGYLLTATTTSTSVIYVGGAGNGANALTAQLGTGIYGASKDFSFNFEVPLV